MKMRSITCAGALAAIAASLLGASASSAAASAQGPAWPAGVPRRYWLAALIVLIGAAAMFAPTRRALAGLWQRTIGRLPFWWRTTVICGAVVVVCLRLMRWPDVRGVPFLFYGGVAMVSTSVWIAATIAAWRRVQSKRTTLALGATAVASSLVVAAVIAFEMVLSLQARSASAHLGGDAIIARFETLRGEDPIDLDTFARAVRRHDFEVMPDEWRTMPLERPGARLAQRWHGVDHVEDAEGVRAPNDPPTAEGAAAGRPVILVIGDSFTYGLGIETRDRFTERLDRLLREAETPVEVVNRGVCSDQSEDVLRRLPANLESFRPTLVIYAICLNDFLPSGVDVYDRSWQMPEWLVERGRLLAVTNRAIVQAQIRLGLSADFHSDILRNLGDCRERFARDVAAMAAMCRERSIPMLAIVLDPIPSINGSGAAIAEAAEDACRRAGILVVDTAEMRRRFDGVPLMVSRWEPHANEIAHAAWARRLFDTLRTVTPNPLESASASTPTPVASP